MKNFPEVKQKISHLSETIGLPVMYKTDLDIWYEVLKKYDGEKFLLILRNCGAQLALLENQTDEYRAARFEQFKFYYGTRDAQFYYCDGENLSAVDPTQALEFLAGEKNFEELEDFEYKKSFQFRDEADQKNFYAEIKNTWSTTDIDSYVKNKGYNFSPKLTAIDKIKILRKMQDIFDANEGYMDLAIQQLFSDRIS